MPVTQKDIKIYGSATMPDDDTVTQIGGAIDQTKTVFFKDLGGPMQVVSSAGGDTTQSVTLHYRDTSGLARSEAKTLNGTTPVTYVGTGTINRLLKAIKSATTTGDVAVEAQTPNRTGTAQGGGTDFIDLDAGASAANDFYNGMVVRLTGGTGAGQIRQIIDYEGPTRRALVDRDWATPPDGTTTFRVAEGMYFQKAPVEVTQVRRILYASLANPLGGAAKDIYDKIFIKNTNATLGLTNAEVQEAADPSGIITFGLPASKDDTGDNGAGNNRTVAPSGPTFNNSAKAVPTSVLGSNEAIGVWVKISLPAGQASLNTTWTPRLVGTSA